MSSRKKKHQQQTASLDADAQQVDQAARARFTSYQQRARAREQHDRAQEARRTYRRSAEGRQPLDTLDASDDHPERSYSRMIEPLSDLDDTGRPRVLDSLAHRADMTTREWRQSRYWAAYRLLALERPAQAAAYFALFHREPYRHCDEAAEEQEAQRLGVTLTLFRSRVRKAQHWLEAECGAEALPAPVHRYAQEREARISRQMRDARAAHWQRVKSGQHAP